MSDGDLIAKAKGMYGYLYVHGMTGYIDTVAALIERFEATHTPGPDMVRLLAAAKGLIAAQERARDGDDDGPFFTALGELEAVIAEHEAVRKGAGGFPPRSRPRPPRSE